MDDDVERPRRLDRLEHRVVAFAADGLAADETSILVATSDQGVDERGSSNPRLRFRAFWPSVFD